MTDARAPRLRRAAFLDRDGTLIDDPGYLADPAAVRLLPGTVDGLVQLRDAGFLLVVITNQSGIGRGLYPASAFFATQAALHDQLAQSGIALDAVYVCPHAPEAGCTCRKPGTALHREAIATLGIDASASWYIGDRMRDLDPSRELGGHGLLVDASGNAAEAGDATARGYLVTRDLSVGAQRVAGYISGL